MSWLREMPLLFISGRQATSSPKSLTAAASTIASSPPRRAAAAPSTRLHASRLDRLHERLAIRRAADPLLDQRENVLAFLRDPIRLGHRAVLLHPGGLRLGLWFRHLDIPRHR